MAKLVFIIGDYSGGTFEDVLKDGIDSKRISKMRSGDSADARVLSELVAQDPDVKYVITLPIFHQFSPNAAGALTKEAIKMGFQIMEDPKQAKGFEDLTDVDQVSIVANVAPGIKSLTGYSVGQNENSDSNKDREAFIDGTVTKGNHTIHVGTTSAFLEGEGHTLGHVTELVKETAELQDENEKYRLSKFEPVDGSEVQQLLEENGQFRSRALLAYMNRMAGKTHAHVELPKKDDLLVFAKRQHKKVSPKQKEYDLGIASDLVSLRNFLPVRPGDAREGFVTVISSAEEIVGTPGEPDGTLDRWAKNPAFKGQLISGLSFDGNETTEDKAVIAGLSPEDQERYRFTRQAFLAANLANEFHPYVDESVPGFRPTGTRTIIIDSEDSPLSAEDRTGDNSRRYDAVLKNGAHIITATPELLALTLDTIVSVSVSINGKTLPGTELDEEDLRKVKEFREHIKGRVIENDPYRNVKLAQTFGERMEEVNNAIKYALRMEDEPDDNRTAGIKAVPDNKAVELTITARTGNLEEERSIYYVPSSTGSFGIWGHPKLSSGSTIIGKDKTTENFQTEIFTPGGPTAGYLFTSIPGVTQLKIVQAQLVNKSVLDMPSPTITGTNRIYEGEKVIEETPVRKKSMYHYLHGKHVQKILGTASAELGILEKRITQNGP